MILVLITQIGIGLVILTIVLVLDGSSLLLFNMVQHVDLNGDVNEDFHRISFVVMRVHPKNLTGPFLARCITVSVSDISQVGLDI